MAGTTSGQAEVERAYYRSRTGRKVHRVWWPAVGEVRGGAVLLHGMGEHAGRYGEVAAVFAGRGVSVCGVDLPGFGRTKGPRGHMEGLWMALVLVSEAVEFLRGRMPEGARLGVVGHSFGGFLALEYLGRFPDTFDFAWLSSPLIDPGRHTRSIARRIALLLEPLVPRLAIDHGVRPESCTNDPARADEARNDRLIHRKVTLRVGRMLLEEAPGLAGRPVAPGLSLLVTLGGADAVCPPETARRFFGAMRVHDVTFREFDGMLHEPFRDVGGAEVLQAVGGWLERVMSGAARPR